MNLHSLENTAGAKKRGIRVGRGHGSGKGKTSGRGHKGQMARSGAKHKAAFEGGQMPLYRRLPKRGFNHAKALVLAPVNVCALDRFEEGSEVTSSLMIQKGLASGRIDGVKVLGTGEISKKLTVKAHAFSKTAREKIEAAGGSVEVIA